MPGDTTSAVLARPDITSGWASVDPKDRTLTDEKERGLLPDIQSAIVNAGLFNAEGLRFVEEIGSLVEENADGLLLTDEEKALAIQGICIWHFMNLNKPAEGSDISQKMRIDLDNIGYECKADEIIRLVQGIKRSGIKSMSDFYFIQELEKLLNYRYDEIFIAIGMEKLNLSQLRGTSGNMFSNYWKDVFAVNKQQWDVLSLCNDKQPSGMIVQHMTDFSSAMVNWIEGLRRAGVDLGSLKLGFVCEGLSTSERQIWESRIRERLKGVVPDNIIFADRFQDVAVGAEKERPENIVYIADEKEIIEMGEKYKNVKFILRHQAGPVLELNLGIMILRVSDIEGIKDVYKKFLKRLVQDKLITLNESQIAGYVDNIMANGFIYIVLPKIEKVLQIWDEFKEFEGQA